ncbi:MAG TPA: gliding motility protein GldL [Bacteroidia bacterium]|jgi:gliding motility-associated protein GldL|nr:gliding motility protein GldL [Bacteroidia bacterium]
MSSKLAKIGGYKKMLHIVASGGASIVIVGALFKIMHWPGSGPMLITGLLTEALIFALYAFDIPHEEWDWSLAYPELVNMGGHHEEGADDHLTATQKLDNMLEQAKIGPELIESLGNSMRSLSDNANKIADMSNAHAATNEYVDSVKNAAKNVNTLSDSYSKAAESLTNLAMTKDDSANFGDQLGKVSKNLSSLNASFELQLQNSDEHLKATSKFYDSLGDMMKNLHDSVDDTAKYKTQIASLSTNLSALNGIYGNMLSAMNYKQ